MRTKRQGGFSLIELMVAMVVTLMITGAVYGLLAGGENAFRREPELSDRQQNIRVAMDMIMRDIGTAGSGMPPFIQSFTRDLDNLGPFVGASGQRTDELELMVNTGAFPDEYPCAYPGGHDEHTFMFSASSNVHVGSVVMVLMSSPPNTWTTKEIVNEGPPTSTKTGSCDSGSDHTKLSFNAGTDTSGFNTPSGLCAGSPITDASGNCTGCTYQNKVVPGTACCGDTSACQVLRIISGAIVRYRIRTGADGVPNLERFASESSADFGAGGLRQYQVVARGVDDLQVRYTAAGGAVTDNPPFVDPTEKDYGTLIQSVSVTLSARSEVANVAGMQTAAAGPAALRGSLTSVGTPRATLNVLATPLAQRASGALASPAPWN